MLIKSDLYFTFVKVSCRTHHIYEEGSTSGIAEVDSRILHFVQLNQTLWLNLAFFGVKVKFLSSFEM